MSTYPPLGLFPRQSQVHLGLGHRIINREANGVAVIREPVCTSVANIADDNAIVGSNCCSECARTDRTRSTDYRLMGFLKGAFEQGDGVVIVDRQALVHCCREVVTRSVGGDPGAFLGSLSRGHAISDDKDNVMS